MNIIRLIIKTSWVNIAIATISGLISGGCTAKLVALINQAVSKGSGVQLLPYYLTLVAIALVTSMLSQFVLIELSQKAIYKLRVKLSRNILASPLAHLESLEKHRLFATLTDDVLMLSHGISVIPSICIELASIVGCLGYSIWIADRLFLATILISTLAVWGIQITLHKAQKLFRFAREEEDNLFKSFQAIILGTKELKLHRQKRENFFSQQLEVSGGILKQKNSKAMKIFALADGLTQLLLFAILGITLFLLPIFIHVSPAVLSAYALTVTYLSIPFQNVLHRLPDLAKGNVALRKIERMRLALADEMELDSIASPSVKDIAVIALHGVSYIYRDREEKHNFELGPIDLALEPGQVTFIVGGNGSGKSTLAKLIAGLYIPHNGFISLNGIEINDNNREWYRQHFSAIFSDFYLFESFLGCDRLQLDRHAERYLKLLELDRKVKINNGVLSTTKLSQGQQKRLALLTAYLEDRPIYLFDEWAADQDPIFRNFFYTELLSDLKAQGKTILVISHDDRYFNLADRLIKIEYGRVISNSDRAIKLLKNS
jgi:putative ATP-binding cassette transporter